MIGQPNGFVDLTKFDWKPANADLDLRNGSRELWAAKLQKINYKMELIILDVQFFIAVLFFIFFFHFILFRTHFQLRIILGPITFWSARSHSLKMDQISQWTILSSAFIIEKRKLN
jgi:hypothetical protein